MFYPTLKYLQKNVGKHFSRIKHGVATLKIKHLQNVLEPLSSRR